MAGQAPRQPEHDLWGVVSEAIPERTGQAVDDVHASCKRKFLATTLVNSTGEHQEVIRSTAETPKVEFCKTHVDPLRTWAARFGIYAPNRNEAQPEPPVEWRRKR
jgi:hypothetical protein